MSAAKRERRAFELEGLSERELELLEELFDDAGVAIDELVPPELELRIAVWESWWVQLISHVTLGNMRAANDAVRMIINLEERWRVNG